MHRTFDYKKFDDFLKSKEIAKWAFSSTPPSDFTSEKTILNKENILLDCGNGFILFEKMQPDVYEGNVYFSSEGSRMKVANDMFNALSYMKGNYILARTHKENIRSIRCLKLLGFQKTKELEHTILYERKIPWDYSIKAQKMRLKLSKPQQNKR